MRTPFLCAALCLLGTSLAQAAPGAPQITVGASNIKELQFDWSPVPQTNSYELWFKANDGAQWVKYAETPAQRPRFRISVAVHLLHWQQARYRVRACNPSGCSVSNTVGVDGLAPDAMGFFKPVANDGRRFFGGNVAVSADGRTIAAVTNEDSLGYQGSAAIYVYRKGTSGWFREARLLTSATGWGTSHLYGGDPVALSGDGNLLVFGALAEDVPDASTQNDAGAVYLFRRNGSAWALSQKLFGVREANEQFGLNVKVDDAGRTVAVLSRRGNSFGHGSVQIFRDPAGGSAFFAPSLTVPVPVADGQGAFCAAIALSGDGNTLLRECSRNGFHFTQVLNAPGFTESAQLILHGTYPDAVEISYDGTVAMLQAESRGLAYRLGPDGWRPEGYLQVGSVDNFTRRTMALSRDGRFAAFGEYTDLRLGIGPLYPPYRYTMTSNGGVTLYERKASGWVFRQFVKPGSANEQWAGHSVALGDNGKVLVVGAPFDSSAATGINGERDDASASQRGAVWVY